jgi:hypothetical protein
MSYTIKERNEAIMLIAAGKADLNNVGFYEDLASFNWIVIEKQDGVINNVQLTYAGKDLNRRLLKNNIR